jgi:hypothetical protein
VAQEYEIRVQGSISERWMIWFDGMKIEYEDTDDGSQFTTLSGPLIDQAALRGILTKLWNLNLTLISVSLVDASIE